jgi:hypothetical protein
MANIKADPAYDPFPKSGLVKQYERFIRKRVSKFCEEFPWVNYDNVLIEAVKLADQAAKRFNPALGYDFSTLLIPYLKKLYAMQEEETGWSHAAPTDWHRDQEASPTPVFPTGANGTRIALDRWRFGYDKDKGDKRKGVVIALQLRDNTEGHSVGFIDRVSAALTVLRDDDGPGADGRLRAAIDHLDRVRREQEAEAEDRQRGIFTPTILEAQRVPLHLQRYEARRRGIPAYSPARIMAASYGPRIGNKALARSSTPSPATHAPSDHGAYPARKSTPPNTTLNAPARRCGPS